MRGLTKDSWEYKKIQMGWHKVFIFFPKIVYVKDETTMYIWFEYVLRKRIKRTLFNNKVAPKYYYQYKELEYTSS